MASGKLTTWLLVAIAVLAGVGAGIGGFTFLYAKGASYLGNDPAACANCHVMNEQYDAWTRSSHHAVATCNDCHAPAGLVGKYLVKARNGFWHSWYFTVGGFPEPIRITPANRAVTEQRCRDCHAAVVEQIDSGGFRPPKSSKVPFSNEPGPSRQDCIRCHRNVGHLH